MNDFARMEANRLDWDRRVAVHQRSDFYDLDGFRAGRSTLRSIELDLLGDVAGRSLLHLQCHFGMDTLSLARLGANVTGVDFSEPAVAAARSLARELQLPARFIRSNLYDLTRVLHQQFDLVFTSYGVLCWLPDLPGWARVVARFLRLGGSFVIVDDHPMIGSMEEAGGRLEAVHSMFRTEANEFVSTGTYADPTLRLEPLTAYDWSWTVAGMVSALLDAGLRIDRLRELPVSGWKCYPSMTLDPEGWWRLPGDPLPLLVACRAVKPAS